MGKLCGIDEAGRGCIAGDLVVAACILNDGVKIAGLGDSKKINEKRRYTLYKEIVQKSSYHIVVIKPAEIDENGISYCMTKALKEICATLQATEYLFDGNCTFGLQELQTMVKADAKVIEVSAASILAKVTHDRNIIEDGKKYPEYGFEKHKGYGTKLHIEMIKKFNYSLVHRKSYKVKALTTTLF